MKVTVVDTGHGNLHSVLRALVHVGSVPRVTDDPGVVRQADCVVLPGQGAFGPCMQSLARTGLGDAIREHIGRQRPYVGICLGLQVLFESSEEMPGEAGLGVLGGTVQRFPAGESQVKVPHMGWNQVQPSGTYYYFVHSYHVVPADRSVVTMTAEHGVRFCAAVRQGPLFACQFHPEKSQRAGLELLGAVLEAA